MQKIKVFIPSYNRPEKICSHLLFQHNPEKYEVKIVLHSQEQKDLYLASHPELEDLILISNVPNSESIGGQRRFIRNQVKHDDWYISIDDDVHGISRVIDELYYRATLTEEEAKNAENFNHIMTPQEFDKFVDETIKECEDMNIRICGFTAVENTLFRQRNNQLQSFIVGIFFIEKKSDDIVLNPAIKIKEDTELTAQYLLRYGRVLKKNYVKPVHKQYSAGGVGSKNARLSLNEEVAGLLIQNYPGLFTYRGDNKSEVTLAIRNDDQLKMWRLKMIALGKLEEEYAYKILSHSEAKRFLDALKVQKSKKG